MSMFGKTEEINSFRGVYGFLSNFYMSPLKYKELDYPSVEHAFQAAKATNDEDFEKVRKMSSPALAKRMGKRIKRREDWESVKTSIMKNCLREKFKNKELADKLLATGNKQLIENNTWGDTEWGVCNGVGKNKLGKLLMEVRVEIQQERK